MNKKELKILIQERLKDAKYWSGKNGYEQETIRELLEIIELFTKVVFDGGA